MICASSLSNLLKHTTLQTLVLCVASLSVTASPQVGSWQAEGDAADSAGTLDGSLMGGASFATGWVGQTFMFDGVDDYVSIGPFTELQMGTTQDFSLSVWLQTSATQSDSVLSNRASADTKYIGYSLQINSLGQSRLTLNVAPGGASNSHDLTGSTVVSDGRWHHIVATVDRDGSSSLYVDGQLEDSDAAPAGNLDSPNPLNIGWSGSGPATPVNHFNGQVDQVQVFDSVLSVGAIQALFGAPISRWRANGDATDSVGTNDAGLISGTTFGQGLTGQAFSLDGVDDYAQIGVVPELQMGDAQDFTMMAWVNSSVIKSGQVLANRHSADGKYIGYGLAVDTLGMTKVTLNVFPGGSTSQITQGTSVVIDGTWHHLACTVDRDGDTTLYVDGQQEAAQPTILGNIDSVHPLNIGWTGSGPGTVVNHFSGRIDDVGVYDRVLSATEIGQLIATTCQQDLGFGGPGSLAMTLCGEPLGTGGLADLTIEGAPAFSTVFLLLSLSNNPVPFKGGFLVPIPFLVLVPVPSDSAGSAALLVPGGGGPLTIFAQAAAQDGTLPLGYAMSNALQIELHP